MFSFFKKTPPKLDPADIPSDYSFLACDMHSHLVPGIDDGSQDLETSVAFIRSLSDKGYKKIITTPHVHLEFYDNNREKITQHFAPLKQYIADHRIGVELEVAAEYNLDSLFLASVLPDGLLTFGDNYVLVEVSMAGWPRNFNDIIFTIQAQGYKPVLAHPERYLYEENIEVYRSLKEKGISLQMNLLSILGYYGKGVKMMAERLLAANLYDFCGTDLHHDRHLEMIGNMLKNEPQLMATLNKYGFRNKELL